MMEQLYKLHTCNLIFCDKKTLYINVLIINFQSLCKKRNRKRHNNFSSLVLFLLSKNKENLEHCSGECSTCVYANVWLILNVTPNFNILLMATILKNKKQYACMHQSKVNLVNQIPQKGSFTYSINYILVALWITQYYLLYIKKILKNNTKYLILFLFIPFIMTI